MRVLSKVLNHSKIRVASRPRIAAYLSSGKVPTKINVSGRG